MLIFTGNTPQSVREDISSIYSRRMKNINIEHRVIGVVWNTRMRSVGGRAKYRENEIHLNSRLLTKNPDQLLTVFLHELAHILDVAKHTRSSHHGRNWQRMMRSLGEVPDRCHTMDVSELKNKTKRYVVGCDCAQTHTVGRIIHGKMQRGANYRCRTCKVRLVLIEKVAA